MDLEIKAIKNINLDLDIGASDKSISHRAAILGLFSDGKCRVKNFLKAQDTLNSLEIAKNLGLTVEYGNEELILTSPKKLQTPENVLDCGNSGTSMRLFSGILAGAGLYAILIGDKYLHKRPMGRVINPLREIGANIISRECSMTISGLKYDNKAELKTNSKHIVSDVEQTISLAPLTFLPFKTNLEVNLHKIDSKSIDNQSTPLQSTHKLKGFNYHSKISSAQVKSAMILAGLFASDRSSFSESSLSRNHTENMILAFQKEKLLNVSKNITITPFSNIDCLNAFDIEIANDPSSAFFFAVLATILPNSEIRLKNVYFNKTRIEAFKILEKMGANLSYENIKEGYEMVGDIIVKSASLYPVVLKDNISWLIDEIPALSIAMALANGKSSVRNAGELRVKESDRISCLLEGLKSFGVKSEEFSDGFDIIGGGLKKGEVNSYGDHRIAMSFIIASLVSGGKVNDCMCINTSFPNFFNILEMIRR